MRSARSLERPGAAIGYNLAQIDQNFARTFKSPATRGDVQRVLDSLNGEGQASAFQSVVHALQTMNKRVGWVWWFSLGALVVAVGHRL